MDRRGIAAIAKRPWVRRFATRVPFVRELAWRFIAGEDLPAAVRAVRRLNANGILVTLNYVGAHVRSAPEAQAATDQCVETLRAIARERLDANLSVKLTQIGLDIDERMCEANLRRILDVAAGAGTFVRIDMEEAVYVDRTLQLFDRMRDAYGNDAVGIVIQSYLRGRGADLDRLIGSRARVRLVKGGYWESADVVVRDPAEISRLFVADIERLVGPGHLPAIATHDPDAIRATRRVADASGVAPDQFEFQMLYGVHRPLQAALVQAGYRVRCYVPYGGNWYDYALGCFRRLPGQLLRRGSSSAAVRPS